MLASNPVCHPTCRNELRFESSTLSRTVKPGESDDVVETKQAEVRSIKVFRAQVLMSVKSRYQRVRRRKQPELLQRE